MNDKYDPITLEIIQSSLQAATDEMFAALRRTAMSAIIYEVLDMGTGITDKNGELAGSGAGIPAFVGVLDRMRERQAESTPSNVDKQSEAVAITTIHSAKGLEWPVVLLTDTAKKFGFDLHDRSKPFLLHPELGRVRLRPARGSRAGLRHSRRDGRRHRRGRRARGRRARRRARP